VLPSSPARDLVLTNEVPERYFSGQVYVMTAPMPLRDWPYEIAYEWGAPSRR
jgi:hypothetical protein